MSSFIRPEIRDFDPYVPGLSVREIKRRFNLQEVIKLASNENPLGVSPLVQKAVCREVAGIFRYPRTHCPALVRALSERLDLPEEMIVPGNGSDEVIDMLMRVRARPGRDHVLGFENSFSMYKLTARLCGIEYRQAPRAKDYGLALDNLARAVDQDTALVFVASPDNPTGHAARAEDLAGLARGLPKGALLVVDEAYIDFAAPVSDYTLMPRMRDVDNVVLLRTFSKAFGLAGLRLGYGVMPAWLAEYVRRARIPFTVNRLAEAAGLAALEDVAFYTATLDVVSQGKQYLAAELERLGCEPTPSQSNFIMFRPPKRAEDVFQNLLEKGIIVRPLASFGLAERIRVNVGVERENRAFVAALEQVLA
ncbi:MAG: histidinol-phosphate transaminase [Desulfovibrionaceae bacterium]|nr:histidinol-phosphate transaminase [Desulfovibrionaceae bacterium]MDD4951029.1 histidinol-phosphate transaminase [Desulfovibrionaceae bacterium]